MKTKTVAIFAAGCFWRTQLLFHRAKGVLNTRVGYTGGGKANPTYEEVCSHATGHAEAVQVEYDPSQISYGELLDIFWQCHDPTQLNRQGVDVGNQYRSAIFYCSAEQKQLAEETKKQYQAKHVDPIVTEIVPAKTFYDAEEYHQMYLEKRAAAFPLK